MKIGFIFPGQGTQTVGMGKDLYEQYEEVRNVYKRVDNAIGASVEDITYHISQEELNETKNTQIAIFTMSMAILEILKQKGIKAVASAGLSLGEYSALGYGNVFSLEEGARIVRKRGEFMQNLVPEGNWAMAAVIGMKDEEVEKVCDAVYQKGGFVKAVNYNCPGQVAISGEKVAVEEAMELAKVEGARKVIPLKTSGPFHTEKLAKASEELRKELKNITLQFPDTMVMKNLDGKSYQKEDDIQEILTKHITNSVKFTKCIEEMLEQGIDTFIEIGPGKVLAGFVKKVCKEKGINAKIMGIENVETLENVLKELEV